MRAKNIHPVNVIFEIIRVADPVAELDDVFGDLKKDTIPVELTVKAQIKYGMPWKQVAMTGIGDSPDGIGHLVIEMKKYKSVFDDVDGIKNGDSIIKISDEDVNYMVTDVKPFATYGKATMMYVNFKDRSLDGQSL